MIAPLTINRSDLAWGLTAVLPHVGSSSTDLDWVGLALTPYGVQIFATDGYTFGIAEVDRNVGPIEGPQSLYLTPKEARDLLKFIRPGVKAEHLHDIQLLPVLEVPDGVDDDGYVIFHNELHVGIVDTPSLASHAESQSFSEPERVDVPESEIYDLRIPGIPFEEFYQTVDKARPRNPDQIDADLVFKPDLFARFSRASRSETDRLKMYPKRGTRFGAAYITVGDHFQGAIAGLSYEEAGYGEEQAA